MDDPFEKYNDNTFLKCYRFPKLIVMDQLVDLLDINYANNREYCLYLPFCSYRKHYDFMQQQTLSEIPT